jgi:hypothetical protein
MCAGMTPFQCGFLAALRTRIRETDDPEMDGTDFAHPAWRRGQEHGAWGVIRAVTETLDHGKGPGTYGYADLEALTQRIDRLRAALAEAQRECRALRDGLRVFVFSDNGYCNACKGHWSDKAKGHDEKCPWHLLQRPNPALAAARPAGD